MTELLEQIISGFNVDERGYYNESNFKMIHEAIKLNKVDDLDISDMYKLIQIQISKHYVIPTVNKIKFMPNPSDSDQVRTLIEMRNGSLIDDERAHIGLIIYILRCRKQKIPLVRFDTAYMPYQEFEHKESSLVCPKCKATKSYQIDEQRQRADEASKIFYRCAECDHEFMPKVFLNRN